MDTLLIFFLTRPFLDKVEKNQKPDIQVTRILKERLFYNVGRSTNPSLLTECLTNISKMLAI